MLPGDITKYSSNLDNILISSNGLIIQTMGVIQEWYLEIGAMFHVSFRKCNLFQVERNSKHMAMLLIDTYLVSEGINKTKNQVTV